MRVFDTFNRAAEQKVIIMGSTGKMEDNKNNMVLNIKLLRDATKMSPPCDLNVAFPIKQDMGVIHICMKERTMIL